MSMLEGLKYSAISSPIHRLDPRTKSLMVLTLFLATILYSDLAPLIIIMLIQIPLLAAAKVARQWLRTLRGAAVFSVFIFATNLLANYIYQDQKLTASTIASSLAMTTRFLALITAFSVFFLTTSPDKLSLTLQKAGLPYELCFAFITAIRFVPVLAEEAQTVIDAQKSRGLELEKGSFMRRIRNYLPILLPLIINSIRRSLELAEAMESRAFGAVKARTDLYELSLTEQDYTVLVITFLLLSAMIYLRFFT